MTELKPCPRCGGEPKMSTNMWDVVVYPDVTAEYTVMCQSCDHEVRSDISMEDAMDGWNRSMKCWYIYGEVCDRPPGICEGCQKYEDWRKESERMTELKPCPFCGGKVEFREMMGVECDYITIHCTKCGMSCTKYEKWGAVDMVEDWNRRVKE